MKVPGSVRAVTRNHTAGHGDGGEGRVCKPRPSRLPLKVRSRCWATAIVRGLTILPRRRPRRLAILFDAFNPMNIACLRPMIDALMAQPNVRVFMMNSRE